MIRTLLALPVALAPCSATLPLLETAAAQPVRQSAAHADVFIEAHTLVRERFYDPALHGVDWNAVRDELLPAAAVAPDRPAVSAVINDALSRLRASHTAHYTPDRREYYELLDVFYPDGVPARAAPLPRGPVRYEGIGLATATLDGRVFAADVYEGGPAAAAGVLEGDELLTVEDGPWSDVAAFRGRAGAPTRLAIRRERGGERIALTVTPERIRPRRLFLESMSAGARLIERDGFTIARVHVRSYAHADYHERLKQLLAGPLACADALVLDLRGGWGGARPAYLDAFNPLVPRMQMQARGEPPHPVDPAWGEPMAVLIDRGTRSGKEVIAYGLRRRPRTTLVGDTTQGAVLGGSLFPLSDGSIILIAVSDVHVDGERLEGVGVRPHVPVRRDLPYAAGRDEQLDAALDALCISLGEQGPL